MARWVAEYVPDADIAADLGATSTNSNITIFRPTFLNAGCGVFAEVLRRNVRRRFTSCDGNLETGKEGGEIFKLKATFGGTDGEGNQSLACGPD